MRGVYMDYVSAMPVDPEVVEAMKPYFAELWGNPSSLHLSGREAKKAMEESRTKIGDLIGAGKANEIIFTSGGTESNNLAIKGVAYRNKDNGKNILTTTIEHMSVLNTCKHLEKEGFQISYVPVDNLGVVDLEKLESEIDDRTILISVVYANSEIGTIQPIKEIGKIAHEKGVYFHVDGVAAVGKVPVDVKYENIDLLSMSSNDMYGPKGIGGLYIKQGTKIEPILHGGGQENGLRSGSENMPGIVGMGKAAELAQKRMSKDIEYLTELRDDLIENILRIEESYLNGHPTKRLLNNAHFRFAGIEGESLILSLDEEGIAASTGSACTSKTLEPSHVLMAIGLNEVEAHGSLLLTLSRNNTKSDVQYILKVLPNTVDRLRAMSPLWKRVSTQGSSRLAPLGENDEGRTDLRHEQFLCSFESSLLCYF